jgi:predicted nucleic acid-binding protein
MRWSPDPGVLTWADRQADPTLFVTTITLAEIRFGIAVLPRGRRRTTLTEAFEVGIRPLFANRVLNFDEPASKSYATLRAEARRRGDAIGNLDAMIAAIARVHRFAIATRDATPFEAVGVAVIDPFA